VDVVARVPEAVADDAVGQLPVAQPDALPRPRQVMRHVAHALHPAGHHHLVLPCAAKGWQNGEAAPVPETGTRLCKTLKEDSVRIVLEILAHAGRRSLIYTQRTMMLKVRAYAGRCRTHCRATV